MFSELFELIGGRGRRFTPKLRQADYTFVYIAIAIIFMTIILVWAFYPKTNSYYYHFVKYSIKS